MYVISYVVGWAVGKWGGGGSTVSSKRNNRRVPPAMHHRVRRRTTYIVSQGQVVLHNVVVGASRDAAVWMIPIQPEGGKHRTM